MNEYPSVILLFSFIHLKNFFFYILDGVYFAINEKKINLFQSKFLD